MAQNFKRVSASSIGTAATTIYTATSSVILIGCNISNLTNFDLPISIWITNSTDTYLLKNYRLKGNDSKEVVQGKIVLESGDIVKAISSLANSIDVRLAMLTGVA
jgi:hypothetical protein